MKCYPKYEESGVEWIGEIPKHWKIVRGKFILSHKKEINSDFQCNNLLSLTLNGVIRKDMDSTVGLRPSDYKTYQVFHPDNLVFKLIDLENIQTSRVGIVPEKGIMSPVYIRLQSKSNSHERYYFYQYYDLYKKHIFNFLGKGVRSSLSPSNLLEIPLAFPPPSEQTQIANFLDRKTEQLDELIRIKERQTELRQEQRTALINQVVTKGLDPNVEMKPSGVEWIGEIPRHWKVKHLKYTADLNMGQSPPSEEYNSDQFGTPFLQGKAEFGPHHPTPKIYCPTAKKHAIPGDILLSVRAPVGAINIADQEYGIGRGLCAIRPRTNQLERHYAKYLLEVVRTELHVVATGTTYDAVTVDEVSNLTCVVPPFSEQKQIANFLDQKTQQIDALIAAEQRKIELLKEYRQSLISEAVTGKIDVRNEV